jgi:hypothetical protein
VPRITTRSSIREKLGMGLMTAHAPNSLFMPRLGSSLPLVAVAPAAACGSDPGTVSAPRQDTSTVDGAHVPSTTPYYSPSLGGRRPFPADNAWNTDVSTSAVDAASSTLIASCGLRNLHADFGTVYNGAPNGISYVFVADNGSGWFVSGAPDSRWNVAHLAELSRVPSSAFDVVRMGTVQQ